MSNQLSISEVEQQFDHLALSGAYAEALELVTREAHRFPDYAQKVVFSWRISMACRLQEKDLALHLLAEAIQAGCWYGGLRADPDFQLLMGDPTFEHLVDVCEERRAQAMANAVPVMKTEPPDARFSPPYPLLFALHGGSANTEDNHWSSAVSRGWFLARPQSSQVYAPGAYTWNDWDWAQQEVVERYEMVIKKHPVDPQRVVMAGFSQGGGLAAWLVFKGAIKARGLILVGPFLPDPNAIIPLLEQHDARGLRVYLVAGQKDRYCHAIAKQWASMLPQYGAVCKFDAYPDLEHSFPVDFEKNLPQALEFVLPE